MMAPIPNSLLLLLFTPAVFGSTICSKEGNECERKYGLGSLCGENGKCTSPELTKGCLQSRLLEWNRKRVCNSEDPPDAAERGLCETPELPYTEIRLYGGNWESRLMQAWLVQIILSELLAVPTTVEGGVPDAALNLYDSSNLLSYFGVNGIPDHTGAFKRGNTIKDCTTVTRNPESYEACAHVALEVWKFGTEEVNEPIHSGLFEPPAFLGMMGHEAIFVTKFTLENDTSFASYLGLRGEERRQKLAETFLRPTTWKDYCDQVSPNNCTIDDGVAKRYPQQDTEEDRMFVEGLFKGHFRATEENDCSLNNETFKCTGHIGDYPCGWESNVEPQMHYLEIPLRSSGKEPNSRGYSYQQLVDMWYAANATRSNLMMQFWSPEPLYQTFFGSDAEMMKVSFPVPTQECLNNRVGNHDKCHQSKEVRLGSELGVCESATVPLLKLFVSSLQEISNDPDDPDAIFSPAYQMLHLYQFSEYQLNQMSAYKEVESSSREAVCRWASENLEYLQTVVPQSYPRTIEEDESFLLGYVATAIAACVAVVVSAIAWKVQKERQKEAIKLAQIGFLRLLLAGSFLISVGAILTGMKPNDFTCVASVWFVNVGYTLELVPLIVKVAAICKITEAAKKMKRVRVRRRQLYRVVTTILFLILVFLGSWTGIDPPQQDVEYSLTEEESDGRTVIKTSYYCSSDFEFWVFAALGWNIALLLIASVWAFQMRRTHAKLNETATLAFLIYSHFMFVVLRALTFMLSGKVQESFLRQMRSLIFAFDTLATMLIYFIPKFSAGNNVKRNIGGMRFSITQQFNKRLSKHFGGSGRQLQPSGTHEMQSMRATVSTPEMTDTNNLPMRMEEEQAEAYSAMSLPGTETKMEDSTFVTVNNTHLAIVKDELVLMKEIHEDADAEMVLRKLMNIFVSSREDTKQAVANEMECLVHDGEDLQRPSDVEPQQDNQRAGEVATHALSSFDSEPQLGHHRAGEELTETVSSFDAAASNAITERQASLSVGAP